MKIIFLGTNGWFDTETGNTISTLITTSSANIFLDAGFGLCKAASYIDQTKHTHILLSHLHLDHIVGLHALAQFSLPKGLTIYAPKDMSVGLEAILKQPFTMTMDQLPFEASIKNVEDTFELAGGKAIVKDLVHPGGCLGYRLEIDNKVITYCTDTGFCDNAVELAKGADLLITECALRKGQSDLGWPHLDPVGAASLAVQAKAKKLALTHFDAYNYNNKEERTRAQAQAVEIFSNSIAASDGMELEVI
ncbi:MAG: MBL fold metallo-hydrolase [PVC group bacterium]|nr:MBL fold metallo-hydrolase [PVC group bacterium]